MDNASGKEEQLREAALDYHRNPTPGKISITPTKTGHGYWIGLADGQVVGFGDAFR